MDRTLTGEKVVLKGNVLKVTAEDFCMEDHEYDTMCAHIGKCAFVDLESCEGYVDVTFEDGFEIAVLSTYHLEIN